MRFGTKWLDLEAQALRDDEGNEHPLTASEFGLLKVFAANPKRVLSRERLLELANARDAEAFDRAVDLRIMRIRRKIEPDPDQAGGDPHHPRRRLSVLAGRRQGVNHADPRARRLRADDALAGASRARPHRSAPFAVQIHCRIVRTFKFAQFCRRLFRRAAPRRNNSPVARNHFPLFVQTSRNVG